MSAARHARMLGAAVSHPLPDVAHPLTLAGLRVDTAMTKFNALAASPLTGDQAFHDAEAAYLNARQIYCDLLVEATGQDAKAIARRLA